MNGVNVFKEIKARVDMPTISTAYGLYLEHGMVRCPFHDDDHPSAKLYQTQLHCFTCSKSWDAIALVAELLGLSPIDAARRIDSDFGLGLFKDFTIPENRRKAKREIAQQETDRALVGNWKDGEQAVFIRLCRISSLLSGAKNACKPLDPDTDTDPLFILALRHFDIVEYCLDVLTYSAEGEKISNFWGILGFIASLEADINEIFSASRVIA